MSLKTNHSIFMLSVAFVFGVIGDIILRTPSHGLNYSIWFIILVTVVLWKIKTSEERLPFTSKLFLTMAVLLACVPTLRDSSVLKSLSFYASFLALFLSSLSFRDSKALSTVYFVPFLVSLTQRIICSALSLLIAIPDIQEYRNSHRVKTPKLVPAILRGLLLSIPLLFVFVRLFMSADKNYESMVHNLWGFNMFTIMENIFFIALYTWLALNIASPFLHAGFTENNLATVETNDHDKWSLETIVILGSVNLVFMSYVYFQLGYLFGGIDHILNTENLTMAEYARRGFFESLLAAALVLIILLTFDEFLKDVSSTLRKWYLGLSFIQVVLVSVVILSGLQRMDIYKSTFGLTEDRFYVYAILLWILGTFAWLMLCLIRHKDHQRNFVLGTLIWGYCCLFAAIGINPHAHIASENISHMKEGGAFENNSGKGNTVGKSTLDSRYLMSLSEDATPALLANLELFSPREQLELMGNSELKYPKSVHTWKNWCWSRSRAHALRKQVNINNAAANVQ